MQFAKGHVPNDKLGSDCLKNLQQNKTSEKEKQSRMWKWPREGWLNTILPNGDNKGV